MRKKSLLVSANAPFIGPRIHLEEGSWTVDSYPEEYLIDIWIDGEEVFVLEGNLSFIGPAIIQAQLNRGNGVSLAIRQIGNA